MKKIIFTIVSNNYLASALSLYDSVAEKCSSEIDFVCLISDKKDPSIRYEDLKFNIIWPEIFLENKIINEMAFKYDVIEFNTSLKPFLINYLMSQLNYERVFYFDPDIYLFDKIDSIEAHLREKDIVLTPHIVECIYRDDLKRIEEDILRNGIYNLGFIGLNKTDETLALIKWWMRKLRNQCYYDKTYFVDQKWMDFINAYSDNTEILRNKIYNVARWNHHERKITKKNGEFFIGDERLCFFHFSGYKAEDVDCFVERDFLFASDKDALKDLFRVYQAKLRENHFDQYRKMRYCYNYFDDGMVISKLNRRLYRKLLEEGFELDNPFETCDGSFYELMKQNGLLSKVYQICDLKISISNANTKAKLHNQLDHFMTIIKKVIGVRRYELLLRYFSNNCSIDDQRFLIKENTLKGIIDAKSIKSHCNKY